MNLKEYLSTLGRGGAAKFAARIGVSASYLSQMASGATTISPARCVQIEDESAGMVTKPEMRSDWQSIWPAPSTPRRRKPTAASPA